MLRESDINRRDKFIKDANDQIQKITEVDLSKPENINAAMSIFQPLINDSNIHQDIGWTKNFYAEQSRADSLTNSHPTKDNPYPNHDWAEGREDLHNQALDYSQTSDQEALGFKQPKYVPAVDYQHRITDLFGKKGMSAEHTYLSSRIGPDGIPVTYKVTDKNGIQSIIPLRDLAYDMVGSDPGVQDMFNVQARNQRRREIDQISQSKFNGDRSQAEDFYDGQVLNQLSQRQASQLKRLGKYASTGNDALGYISESINNSPHGVSQDNPKITTMTSLMDMLKSVKGAADNLNSAKLDPANLITASKQNRRYQVENAMAHDMMLRAFGNIAHDWAMANASSKMTEDRFSLNAQNHAYKIDEIQKGAYYKALYKGGLSQGPRPEDSPITVTDPNDVKLNPTIEKTAELQLAQSQKYDTFSKDAMKNYMEELWQGYAKKLQFGTDAEKGAAKVQLSLIFPDASKELMSKAANTGSYLTSMHIYDTKAFNDDPLNTFNHASSYFNDNKLGRIIDPGVISNLIGLYTEAQVQKSAFDASTSEFAKNNLGLLKYAHATNNQKLIQASSIFSPSGTPLEPEQYFHEMNKYGKFTRDQTDQMYRTHQNNWFQAMDNHPAMPGENQTFIKPVYDIRAGAGLTVGNTSRQMIYTNTDRGSNGQYTNSGVQGLSSVYHTLDNYNPDIINAKGERITPDNKDYDKYKTAISNIFNETIKEVNQGPKKSSKAADGSWVDAHPTKNQVDIVPSEKLWAEINKSDIKGGAPSKTGLSYDDFKKITLDYKDKSPPEVFDKFKYDATDHILDSGHPLVVNLPPMDYKNNTIPYKLTLSRNSQGGIDANMEYPITHDNYKTFVKGGSVAHYTKGSNADDARRGSVQYLKSIYDEINHLAPKAPGLGGPIKTGDEGAQVASSMIDDQEPDDNDTE